MAEGEQRNLEQPNRIALTLVSRGLVSVRDAAAFLGVSRAFLYKEMQRGALPWARIGRVRRVPRAALVDYAAARLAGEAPGCSRPVPNDQ